MTPTNIPADPSVAHAKARGTAALWFGVLGAPAAWLLQFQLNYILIPWACPKPWLMTFIRLATLLFLLAVVAAGLICRREWERTRGNADGEDAAPVRTRFLAHLGMMHSALFFLLILAQGIAMFLIDPCWD